MPRRDRPDDLDDEEYDDAPRRPRREGARPDRGDGRPGMATGAAVLWLVSAGFLLVAFAVRAYLVLDDAFGDGDGNPVCGGIDVLMVLGLAAGTGLAGVLTLVGGLRSLAAPAALSLILPPAMLFVETVIAFLTGVELVKDRGPSDVPMRMAVRTCFFNTVLVSGVLLAGVLALSAKDDYRRWAERRSRPD